MQVHEACLCIHNREHAPLLCSDSHQRTPLKPSRGCEGYRWSKKDLPYSHALRRGLRHVISVLRSPSPKLKEWGRGESLVAQNAHRRCLAGPGLGLRAPAVTSQRGGRCLDGRGHAQGLTWQGGAADGAGRSADLGLLLSTVCRGEGCLSWLLMQLSGVGGSLILFCLCRNSQLGKQARTEFMSVAFSIWRVGRG